MAHIGMPLLLPKLIPPPIKSDELRVVVSVLLVLVAVLGPLLPPVNPPPPVSDVREPSI